MTAGTKLGPYEILAPIGAGGMGEVYRAKDTKLDREVAIKVLPPALAQDPERLARFEREAKVLASLNHPNIAQIYGIEDRALVMELVDGQTLQGPLSLETALNYAHQIADALEAAHEKNIIHRDLKPANIMITPTGAVKVLDFGLAAVAQSSDPSNPANSPTLTISPTRAGMIMGTAAYMSPEQARGKAVDKRADIWAFGVVLFEMLTGKPLFEGETVSDTLAQVLTKEPDFDQVPQKVRRLLRKCLEKDPKKRLRDIGDAWELVEEAPVRVQRRPFLAWGLAGLFALVAATTAPVALRYVRQKPPATAAPIRFQILPPEETPVGLSEFTLSPDGRRLVYATAGSDGVRRLWLRSFDSLETKPLPGSETEGTVIPFWSPDSRYVAFPAGGKLKKMDIGEPAEQRSVQTICDVSEGRVAGGSWGRDGTIIFGTVGTRQRGIQRVDSAGGMATPVTLAPASEIHLLPTFLPDGKHFLYLRASQGGRDNGVFLGSLDAKPEQQDSRRFLATPSGAVYAPDGDAAGGQVLFVREGTIFAQRLDARVSALTGEPVPIAEGVARIGLWGAFSASENGVLVYVTGEQETQATWFDRRGKVVGLAKVGSFLSFAPSPDGTKVVYADGVPSSLWLLDRSRNNKRPLTRGSAVNVAPVWSWDGNKIAYEVIAAGAGVESGLYQKDLNDDRAPELLLKASAVSPTDWSADGRYLIYTHVDPKTQGDIWALPLDRGGQPFPLLHTESNESGGVLSPDMRWIAYVSDESGRNEIYVRPFNPAPAGSSRASSELPVSNDGGWQVRWRRDGKELFYQTSDGRIMSTEVATGPMIRLGVPKVLFQVQPIASPTFFGVSADGSRFLVIPQGKATATPFTVVLNWTSLLKK